MPGTKPGVPAKRRTQQLQLELRMAKEGYINPSRVAETVGQSLGSVYRWGETGKVTIREVQGRRFFEMNSLAKWLRDPEKFKELTQYLAGFIALNSASDGGST